MRTSHIFSSVFIAFAPAAAASAPASFSEKGDPTRWYQPLETQRDRRDNAMNEARNALAEALRECRTAPQRKACEASARDQYQKDAARARAFLAPTRQIG